MSVDDMFSKLIECRTGFIEALKREEKNIILAANLVVKAFKGSNKLLICGNGGSAADAQHMAAELVGKFKKLRRALPAIALTTDTSALTAIANDWEYAYVFERQLEALGTRDDIVIGISTSGGSPNVINALRFAKSRGMYTIGLVGSTPNMMEKYCDVMIVVGGNSTEIIQERHLAVEHMICEIVEVKISSDK